MPLGACAYPTRTGPRVSPLPVETGPKEPDQPARAQRRLALCWERVERLHPTHAGTQASEWTLRHGPGLGLKDLERPVHPLHFENAHDDRSFLYRLAGSLFNHVDLRHVGASL